MTIHSARAADEPSSIRFDDFYADRWAHAFRLAALLTHDHEAGADIAQDVFAAMSRRWETIERPDAYLQRALTNAASNWRRSGRTAERNLHLLVARDDDDVDVDSLADAIARLPFRQRAVVVLRYYADLSEAEIAPSCRGDAPSRRRRYQRSVALTPRSGPRVPPNRGLCVGCVDGLVVRGGARSPR